MSKKKGCSTVMQYIQNREYNVGHMSCKCLMRGRLRRAQNLFRKDLYSHYGCVNAIEFSHDGEWLVSGGDDRRILVWNVGKSLSTNALPITMKGEHGSNIFCLGFDNHRLKIFSAGNDEQVIVHDFATGATLDVFLHEEAVYGLTIDPLNDNVFASACEDGRILIWDIREPASTAPFCLANSTSAFHAVMFNPLEPRLLATANSKEGVSLWDIRKPRKEYIRYGSGGSESCMSVRFNSDGTRILALRRRLPPILYNLNSSTPLCQFDHKEYYNSCTMKSCCFAGDEDQYVLSGSDDFNLYMWKVPEEGSGENWVEEAHIVLRGHRSIVNQVRFNYSNFLLASSGVEKIIKLWSPFPMPNASGGLSINECIDKERKVYSHEEYINLILQSGQVMSHDYSHKSTMEDPRMMAFFDSLVQREIEGWNSDTSNTTINTETWIQDDALVISDSGTSSTLSSEDEDFANSSAIISPSAIAYGLSVVTNHLDQDHQTGEDHTGEVHETQGEEVDGGSQHANRISQLIAQKREQLMRAARAKVMQRRNRRRRLFSRLARMEKDSPAKTRHRLFSSTDDSSEADEAKTRAEVRRKLSALRQSTTTLAPQYRRRCLRKRRPLMTNTISDSDSDMSSDAFGPRKQSCVVNGDRCENADDDSTAKPSTSQEKTAVCSSLVCYDTSDSSEDGENGDSPQPVNDDALNDKYGSSSTGTPDSGISSNTCDNSEMNAENPSTVWTQFKRIRSRLERVCRNYRTRNSD